MYTELRFDKKKELKNEPCRRTTPRRRTVGQIPKKCKETSNLILLLLIVFLLKLILYNIKPQNQMCDRNHGLRTSSEEITLTWPKIKSQSMIFRYSQSISFLAHWPKISDFFDLCLHCMSVVRDRNQKCFCFVLQKC